MRIPWTASRSNQSIIKEISSEYSLEGLMLKLKLQYCGHLMRRTDSFEKTLMLGKTEDKRKRGRQRMRRLDGITNSKNTSLSKFLKPGVLQSMGWQKVRHNRETKQRPLGPEHLGSTDSAATTRSYPLPFSQRHNLTPAYLTGGLLKQQFCSRF